MALNRIQYKNKLLALFHDMRTRTNQEDSDEEYAERFTQITEEFIKTGTVNTVVQTTGSATNHTGTGQGTII